MTVAVENRFPPVRTCLQVHREYFMTTSLTRAPEKISISLSFNLIRMAGSLHPK
jgi:hypothetical protein